MSEVEYTPAGTTTRPSAAMAVNGKKVTSGGVVTAPSEGDIVWFMPSDMGWCKIKKPMLAMITGGQYHGTYGISNHWDWRQVRSNGTLGKSHSGYGNFYKAIGIKSKWTCEIVVGGKR